MDAPLAQKSLAKYEWACLPALLLFVGCSLQSIAQTELKPLFEQRACAAAPDLVQPVHKVSVLNLGWHTGIVFTSLDAGPELKRRIAEFRLYPFVEIGWGDGEFYRASGYSYWKGLKALFFADGAVLHVTGFGSEYASYASANQEIELQLSEEGFSQLSEYILQSIDSPEETEAVALGRALYGRGHFYGAKGHTSIFRTCNTWTANALKKAGCDVSTRSTTASGLMKDLLDLPRQNAQAH
jgi:uncharacterized protein (TIGR02117 family)